ncbi:SMI1/KNR4 family protein [Cellulosimicrobium sp. KWT-B]|uniref:SMI1/KNR4 family protein n=1 Tax=Cellulosimicrobium sp. KWT-B TaxID=1981152 RepID=UPI000A320593|nr:SMI1/KNR4 family protein [Cellulosimicrobium sp. KWT-B]
MTERDAVDTDWHAVRERVLALGRSDRRLEVFGAMGHEFRLDEPLTRDDLAEAEAQWGVTLPADYREFLRIVGAGGAGPFYGLVTLELDGSNWRWQTRPMEVSTDVHRLAAPFPGPIEPERLRQALTSEPDQDSFDDEEAFDAAYEAWRATFEGWYYSDDHTVGAVYLAHQGCAYYDWLIVSGPLRGQVWTDNRADDGNLYPSAASFTEWYLRWLDEAEATLAPAATPRS